MCTSRSTPATEKKNLLTLALILDHDRQNDTHISHIALTAA
jgi:hypothetical protein